MRIPPYSELLLVAALGSAAAAGVDVVINGAAAGIMKAAGALAAGGLAPGAALVLGAGLLAASGPASVFYFRPLTRRGAFSLAICATAVVSMLVPRF